ncbi:hypothetical protein [Phaeocystidibacter luteus]|uniref:Uncharacterized protein n=1 Tax=Phaeocystidibacter luteus TaxID=911197 RepID=A0A6N6RJI2_9FLAO|nr:hypothetical protein [Phaeocystidibacter luteus]KAB2813883.1 hypothetical protein F8C67_04145 [Phaeocystidibacter luteus]
MKINNTNIRRHFWIVLSALLLISIMDFILARISGTVNELFWGYLFAVNIILVALVYTLFGKPIFRFNESGEVLEISNGLALGRWLDEKVLVNRGNLVRFTIEKKNLRSYLVLNILQQTGIRTHRFSISFLSRGKREKLRKRLQEMVIEKQEGKDVHLFI